ncbi:MAG TPA: hypothetical protein V6D25_05735 [Leptolyngbyaceae cyanobacterium]
MNKKFFLAALTVGTAALASTFSSAPAKAADVSADVEIQVDVPEVVFLQTYETLTFKPTIEELTGKIEIDNPLLVEEGEVALGETSEVDPKLDSGDATPTLLSDSISKEVLVYKVWGLGGTQGNIKHTATYESVVEDKLTLKNAEGTITSSVGVTVTDVEESVAAPGLDYAEAIEGNVNFTFDFTETRQSGLHTGGTLTVEATAE